VRANSRLAARGAKRNSRGWLRPCHWPPLAPPAWCLTPRVPCASRVVHRDLKPHNIFLGVGDEVKIGDFGVSRQLSSSREMAMTIVGSPGYLSPELCNGEPYNEKADIWSLGVLLSELCALKHPFGDANSQAALVMKIMRAAPPALPAHYSPQLARLLVCCMQRQQLSRPSALQLLSLSTVQQHAARLDLLQHFPPSALRAGAASAIASESRAAPPPPADRRASMPFMVPPVLRRHQSLSENMTPAPSRRAEPDPGAAAAAHGRRQGEAHQRQPVAAASCAPTLKASSGAWELRPVCAARQRAGTCRSKNWQTAESLPAVGSPSDSSDDELGPPAYAPPRPAQLPSSEEKAWTPTKLRPDFEGRGRGKAVEEIPREPPLQGSHPREPPLQGSQPRSLDVGWGRPQGQGGGAPSDEQEAQPLRSPSLPLRSPNRKNSALWAKRRGAEPSPEAVGKLQVR